MVIRFFQWSDRWLLMTLKLLTGLSFGCVLFSVVVGVLCRFILKSPIGWTEEFSRLTFVWMVFMSACVATHDKTHITIRIFSGKLGPRGAAIHDLVTSLLSLTFFAVVLAYGPTLYEAIAVQFYAGLPLSQKWQVLPILIGAAVMSLYLIRLAIMATFNLFRREVEK